MTSTAPKATKAATTSGLPTACHHFPPGTPGDICLGYNRACKAARIISRALAMGYDSHLTDAEMDLVADAAGVRPAGGQETREAVRAGLLPPLTDADCNQDIAQAVENAVTGGEPFQYRNRNGRTVLLVPLPVGE